MFPNAEPVALVSAQSSQTIIVKLYQVSFVPDEEYTTRVGLEDPLVSIP